MNIDLVVCLSLKLIIISVALKNSSKPYNQNTLYSIRNQRSMTSTIRDFIVQRKLGEGSFSEVFQVVRKSDSAVYAMKKVKMQKLSSKEKENALNEVRILASISHPNVIGYKEAFFEDATNSLCIVMEHADGGDILQLINNQKKSKVAFSEKQIWHYFIQIIRGLHALHALKICHRDIKCANLFLTKEGVIKLGDLNVSKVAKRGMLRTQTGTPYYACPEVWKDMPYDHRSDIWSLGCVLYEMITFQPPFRATTMKGLYAAVIKGKYDPIGNQYSNDLKNLLKSCLQVKSADRADCTQILATPGLLNHITGTLNDIQARKGEDTEILLNTIRLPRNLGMITGVMPAAQYKGSAKRQVSTPRQAPIEAIVNDLKEKIRVSSAIHDTRKTQVENKPQKRALSSHSNNQPLKPHLSSRGSEVGPTNSEKSNVKSTDANEILAKNQRIIQQLQNNIAQQVTPELAIIEETEHDMGTGMDNIKIELKGNNILYRRAQNPQPIITLSSPLPPPQPVKKVEPKASLPASLPSSEPVPVEKRPLYRPTQEQKFIGAPYSVDMIQRKAALYRDLSTGIEKHPEPIHSSRSVVTIQDAIVKKVIELKSLQQKHQFHLPQIKPRKNVHQSVDSLPKISDLYKGSDVLSEKPNMNNLRNHHRLSSEQVQVSDLYINKLNVPKLNNRILSRPQSKAGLSDGENQAPVGFRAMLKRHQESQNQHIDRIRKNLPSSHDHRSRDHQRDIGILAIAGGEEVMRLKHELAMKRAKRLDKARNNIVYKPSEIALNQYSPYKHPSDYQYEPITERKLRNDHSQVAGSARIKNIVSENVLRDLRRIM